MQIFLINPNSGIIGLTLNTDWQVPEDPNSERDLQASHRAIHFMFGWFLNPVMKGDYPAVMKEQVDRKSRAQGYNESRLPEFSATEKDYIKGIHLYFTNASYEICSLHIITKQD